VSSDRVVASAYGWRRSGRIEAQRCSVRGKSRDWSGWTAADMMGATEGDREHVSALDWSLGLRLSVGPSPITSEEYAAPRE
jgi:hypothetical protein